jgi:hypothetical protein
MDRETAEFCYVLQGDQWAVLDFDPLPADLDRLRHARDILYAIMRSSIPCAALLMMRCR